MRSLRTALFSVDGLLFFGSTNGASTCARAAVNASVRVNDGMAVFNSYNFIGCFCKYCVVSYNYNSSILIITHVLE